MTDGAPPLSPALFLIAVQPTVKQVSERRFIRTYVDDFHGVIANRSLTQLKKAIKTHRAELESEAEKERFQLDQAKRDNRHIEIKGPDYRLVGLNVDWELKFDPLFRKRLNLGKAAYLLGQQHEDHPEGGVLPLGAVAGEVPSGMVRKVLRGGGTPDFLFVFEEIDFEIDQTLLRASASCPPPQLHRALLLLRAGCKSPHNEAVIHQQHESNSNIDDRGAGRGQITGRAHPEQKAKELEKWQYVVTRSIIGAPGTFIKGERIRVEVRPLRFQDETVLNEEEDTTYLRGDTG
ncbi:hypothetical protein BDZ91DRAFT_787475 [Kalaharituber pfeilii]|nr:hypothetical protein BDZ91DRAFT_787475 [Kalaharituber pfeilii]